MATITKTIKPSGGDYSSLSNWEAGEQADLVAAGNIAVAECYAMTDTAQVVINGWNTGANNYINIYTPISERHNGTRSPTKYLLEVNTGVAVPAFYIYSDYVRVDGLQVSATYPYGSNGIDIASDYSFLTDIRITNTLMYDCTGRGITIGGGVVSMNNCAIMNCDIYSGLCGVYNIGAVQLYIYNCTIVNSYGYGLYTYGYKTTYAKNCYSGGNSSDAYHVEPNGTFISTTCYSDDGTLSTTVATFSVSSGCYFYNIIAGSEDLHIGNSSTLKYNGTNLSSDTYWINPTGSTDIVGVTRTVPWDIGAYVSVGPTSFGNFFLFFW